MELYQLRSFLAVAEEQNLTRAAERLNTSQPALSAQIRALEEELGLTLFLRTSRGMRITENGRELLGCVQQTLTAAGSIIEVSKRLQTELRGTFSIGTNSTPEVLKLSTLIGELNRIHPNLTIHLVASHSAEILDGIRSGSLDAGFVFGPAETNGINTLRLDRYSLVIAGAASTAFPVEGVSWRDMASLPWIGNSRNCPFNRHLDRVFDEQNLRRNITVVADQPETVVNMVCAGTGIAVLLFEEIRDRVASGTLSLWEPFNDPIELSFAFSESKKESPAVQAVLNVMERIWGVTVEEGNSTNGD